VSRPDIGRVLVEVALRLQVLERDLEVSVGVDDLVVEAMALLADAVVTDTVFVGDGPEPYIVREATARIGRVALRALANRRPATSVEIEAAGSWREHVAPDFRSATVRRTP